MWLPVRTRQQMRNGKENLKDKQSENASDWFSVHTIQDGGIFQTRESPVILNVCNYYWSDRFKNKQVSKFYESEYFEKFSWAKRCLSNCSCVVLFFICVVLFCLRCAFFTCIMFFLFASCLLFTLCFFVCVVLFLFTSCFCICVMFFICAYLFVLCFLLALCFLLMDE